MKKMDDEKLEFEGWSRHRLDEEGIKYALKEYVSRRSPLLPCLCGEYNVEIYWSLEEAYVSLVHDNSCPFYFKEPRVYTPEPTPIEEAIEERRDSQAINTLSPEIIERENLKQEVRILNDRVIEIKADTETDLVDQVDELIELQEKMSKLNSMLLELENGDKK